MYDARKWLKRTRSRTAFMIHSPPLLSGPSLMIPTRASSAHTRRTGRWRDTRVESSFSRCSGESAASAAREGGARAAETDETMPGVNALGNRRCKADMIYAKGYAELKGGPRGSSVTLGLTSTALHTSFSVLHRKMPSAAAPTISSTYFSRDRESISLRI